MPGGIKSPEQQVQSSKRLLATRILDAADAVVAKGPTFTANLNLVTRGDNQSVTIKSHDDRG